MPKHGWRGSVTTGILANRHTAVVLSDLSCRLSSSPRGQREGGGRAGTQGRRLRAPRLLAAHGAETTSVPALAPPRPRFFLRFFF